MNRGVLQSLPVQLMNMGGSWWNINTNIGAGSQDQINLLLSSSTSNSSVSSSSSPPPSSMFPPFLPPSSLPINPWLGTHEITTDSLSQLDMGGMVAEEERCSFNQFLHKKMEDWSDQLMYCADVSMVDVKQESSDRGGYLIRGHHLNGTEEFEALKSEYSSQALTAAYSPRSCVTNCTLTNSMLDFSTRKREEMHQEQPDQSLERNSSQTGSAYKKARVLSTPQPPFKVRKEKLGDRVTALHQLVSPFGKTDTASVLLEAFGYIRFLQNQIEALSSPYLGSASKSVTKRQLVQSTGERSSVFPEDQSQLLPDACIKMRGTGQDQKGSSEMGEPKKDLCSRGLCLVPVAYCTTKVGNDNGADYWAPAAAAFGGRF